MKSSLLAAFFANVATSLVSLWLLPARVPVHFGSGGEADGWARADHHVLGTIILLAVLLLPFYFASRLLFAVPPRWVNLPNKDYWLRDDNRPRAKVLADGLMWEFGTVLFAYLLVVQILVIRANHVEPPRLDVRFFLSVLVAFFAYTAWWCVKFYRRFRLPTSGVTRRFDVSKRT